MFSYVQAVRCQEEVHVKKDAAGLGEDVHNKNGSNTCSPG